MYFCLSGSAKGRDLLMPDAARLVQDIINHLLGVQQLIKNRSIDVQTTIILKQHQDTFRKLCNALGKIKDTDVTQTCMKTELVFNELEKRTKEVHHFQALLTHIQNFLNICQTCQNGERKLSAFYY